MSGLRLENVCIQITSENGRGVKIYYSLSWQGNQ